MAGGFPAMFSSEARKIADHRGLAEIRVITGVPY
jgi:hypothetical protein